MNKSTFVKFSLTLVSAAVLAACSSGSSSDDQAKIDAEKQAEIQKELDLKKQKEAEELAKAEEAVKKAVSVGHKVVFKEKSNLNVGSGAVKNSDSGAVSNMGVVLEPSLDTVVVATPTDGSSLVYLEDFDFRKAATDLATAATDGKTKLSHVYVKKSGITGATEPDEALNDGKTLNVGVDRDGGRVSTKTDKKGQSKVDALVFKTGLKNYTDRVLTGTVAEVYGARTFVVGDSEHATDAADQSAVTANAPFLKADANGDFVEGDKLNYVQYGRVTSALDSVSPTDLADGLTVSGNKTKIAAYGIYGGAGTENQYFYRGVADTNYNADLAAELKKAYPNDAELVYQGHAVTVGIDHAYASNGNVPNAIASNDALVSGTHVNAKINLADKSVSGGLYDVWKIANETSMNQLVSFKGTLANNGVITGSSTLENGRAKGDAGTFNANLFGNGAAIASELGGAVKSVNTGEGAWAAVFGAKVQQSAARPGSLNDATDSTNRVTTPAPAEQ